MASILLKVKVYGNTVIDRTVLYPTLVVFRKWVAYLFGV